ncbi:MAG: hypothetical protein GWN07_10495, partial [Actinobacteria bacterium]|nr:hypothetical protein [Actinomycetota bacterium]NIU65935.1 hypothetical protein [Actinomycetota bacterium]NIV86792.1 hypothetical protein [Actinomycetota bacterium]NIW27726.1 hypothetical protein [Actinomycetota bacterium]NIX20232.1 hypothetical protein [Actinomycetota bacterium]
NAAGVLMLAPEGMGRPALENEIRTALSIPVAVVNPERVDDVRAAAEA